MNADGFFDLMGGYDVFRRRTLDVVGSSPLTPSPEDCSLDSIRRFCLPFQSRDEAVEFEGELGSEACCLWSVARWAAMLGCSTDFVLKSGQVLTISGIRDFCQISDDHSVLEKSHSAAESAWENRGEWAKFLIRGDGLEFLPFANPPIQLPYGEAWSGSNCELLDNEGVQAILRALGLSVFSLNWANASDRRFGEALIAERVFTLNEAKKSLAPDQTVVVRSRDPRHQDRGVVFARSIVPKDWACRSSTL